MKTYFWLYRPEIKGVKSLIFNDNRLLLVRLGYAHRKWVLPGGKVDSGEELAAAAKRELQEESGLVVEQLEQCGSLYNEAHYKKNTIYYFYGVSDSDNLVIDDQEIVDAGWFSLDALPKNSAPKVQQEIELYNKWKYANK